MPREIREIDNRLPFTDIYIIADNIDWDQASVIDLRRK
jgi:hypothetical protein